MRSFTYTIHIDRAPDRVWSYMMDFSQAPRWRNLVSAIEVDSPGPLAVGSRLRVTYEILGRRKQALSEVWAFEPGRRLGLRNTEQRVTGSFQYLLEPDSGGTRVTFTCDVRPRGLMWLLVPWLIKGNRARYRQQLPALKAEVERGQA